MGYLSVKHWLFTANSKENFIFHGVVSAVVKNIQLPFLFLHLSRDSKNCSVACQNIKYVAYLGLKGGRG